MHAPVDPAASPARRRCGRATTLAALALVALPASLVAREVVLIGLADLNTLESHRVVRKEGDAVTDQTRFGMRAGLEFRTEENGNEVQIAETRAAFKPTLFQLEPRVTQGRVVEVGMQIGGGAVNLAKIDSPWGAGTPAADVFDLPTSPLTNADLVSMFQQVLDSRGASTVTSGIMVTSAQRLQTVAGFSARFTVRVQEGADWVISASAIQIRDPGTGAFTRALRLRTTRRGNLALFLNGVEFSADPTGAPVFLAANYDYVFSLRGNALAGTNTLVIRVTDPEDGATQEETLTFTG